VVEAQHTVNAKSRGQATFLLFFTIFSIALLLFAFFKPLNNWDMVAYAGSAKSYATSDKKAIHEFAYSELEQYAGEETFIKLTASSSYRRTFYSDPEAFRQALPWYQIRPAYTGLMYVLHAAGMNIYQASRVVSAVAVLFAIWVFYFAFRRYVASILWFAVPFFIVLYGGIENARLSTPDGLAFLYSGTLTYLFLRRSRWAPWLLPVAILIRTDLIFLVALFAVYLFWFEKAQRISATVSLLASLTTYLVINKVFGNYGWSTVFYLVFISDFTLNYPADKDIHISFIQYFHAVLTGARKIIENDKFNAFIGISLLHAGTLLGTKRLAVSLHSFMSQRINALAAISISYVFIHFLVFPAGYSRFFTAQYLTGLLCFLSLLTQLGSLHSAAQQDSKQRP
jgi:hypothetical protein